MMFCTFRSKSMFNCANCDCVAKCVGYLFIAYVIIGILRWIQVNFFASVNVKSKYNPTGDKWAVVTGASDGIGRAMAVDLAKRGINVVIIARSKDKLNEVAQKIEERKVQAKVIQFDFSTAGDAQYAELFAQLDKLSVTMLVNNVGINYEHPMGYTESDISMDLKMLKVNCETQLRMTKYVLPKMKANRYGAIVDLSSTFSRAGAPLLSTYGGTKAFNAHFSSSLATEVAEFGIDVLTVYPMMVCSQMSGRKRPTFDCPDARVMAAHTLNKLGSVSQTPGHRHHALLWSIASWLPMSLIDGKLLSINKGVQKKALKKKAESPK